MIRLQPKRERRYRVFDEWMPTREVTRLQSACRAKLILPSADGSATVVFSCCATHRGDPDSTAIRQTHVERGRVRLKDGTVRTYNITWEDAAKEVWRA